MYLIDSTRDDSFCCFFHEKTCIQQYYGFQPLLHNSITFPNLSLWSHDLPVTGGWVTTVVVSVGSTDEVDCVCAVVGWAGVEDEDGTGFVVSAGVATGCVGSVGKVIVWVEPADVIDALVETIKKVYLLL